MPSKLHPLTKTTIAVLLQSANPTVRADAWDSIRRSHSESLLAGRPSKVATWAWQEVLASIRRGDLYLVPEWLGSGVPVSDAQILRAFADAVARNNAVVLRPLFTHLSPNPVWPSPQYRVGMSAEVLAALLTLPNVKSLRWFPGWLGLFLGDRNFRAALMVASAMEDGLIDLELFPCEKRVLQEASRRLALCGDHEGAALLERVRRSTTQSQNVIPHYLR